MLRSNFVRSAWMLEHWYADADSGDSRSNDDRKSAVFDMPDDADDADDDDGLIHFIFVSICRVYLR